ncbi:cellulase family glycosylhydrolase [Streptacidiphilus sp. 4-A2]|nr:cellulase family glycosylhydrolase [Streptacidiphilus sp. 4-A2]
MGMAGRLRRWLVGLVVIACAAGLLAAVGPASSGQGPWQERFVTDARGRALILYGLNTREDATTSGDGMPWIKKSDVSAEYSLLGTDFVRYLISWQQVEPEPGQFDLKYLAQVAQRISWYQQQGYLVLLDMQQTIRLGAGRQRAPPWATDSGGLPATPQSSRSCPTRSPAWCTRSNDSGAPAPTTPSTSSSTSPPGPRSPSTSQERRG